VKKEGNKPRFRSEAKRAGFEYIENEIRKTRAKYAENKFNQARIAREQGQLKKDLAGLFQVREEFLK
jgi:hypothetical protein